MHGKVAGETLPLFSFLKDRVMKPGLHPACAVFPPMPDEDMKKLAEDIRQNGLIEPITMLGGLLLDGRCRWDACKIVGVEPSVTEYSGDDPISFLLSKNLHRRQLSTSQKAMVAARLANLQHGTNRFGQKVEGFAEAFYSRADVAKASKISVAQVQFAKRVITQAAPHIIQMVDDGSVRVQVAAEAIQHASREEQESWTQKDVERRGYGKIRAYPSNQRGTKTVRQRAKAEISDEQPRTIHVPYGKALANFPTEEESPRDRIRAEKGYEGVVEHQLRYGRTPLCPDRVKDMMICDGITATLTAPIRLLASPQAADAEQFFDAIDQMLAWVPVVGKTNGMERDFAKKARATLAELGKTLPAAVERLTTLLDALRARSADKAYGEHKQPAELAL